MSILTKNALSYAQCLEIYTYATPRPNGGKTITVRNGILNGTTVTQGTATTTTYNAHGTPILRTTTLTGANNSITTDSYEVTAQDGFGRALTTSHFPGTSDAFTTAATYNCCGLASSTDMHGVTTDYAYDGLRRQTKVTSSGVTTETVHNGLTTSTHRYPSGGSANPGNCISRVTRNLSGSSVTSESPDPSSTNAGDLTATTTTTTYGDNLSVTTTVIGTHDKITTSYADGRAASASGTLQPNMTYSYGVNNIGLMTTASYLDGNTTRETIATQTDWAGRTVSTQKGTITNAYAYNDSTAAAGSRGKIKSVTDASGVITLYAYNGTGELTTTARKLDASATITYGNDQIARTETVPATRAGSTEVLRTRTIVWQDGAGENDGTVVSYTDRTASGLDTWSWQPGAGETHTVSTIGLARTETTYRPGGLKTVTTYAAGLPWTVVHYDSNNLIVASTTYTTYDSLKRPTVTTDLRTGSTTTEYMSGTCDAVKSVVDSGTRVTSYTYDFRGNRITTTLPDESVTRAIFTPKGQVEATWGSQTYSVFYKYDYAGRMLTLRTTPTFDNNIPTDSGGSVTTWVYDPATGQLLSKLDHSGKGPAYTYTPAGRLQTRTWADNTVTTYGYDMAGRLSSVAYSNEPNGYVTPGLAYTLDALGRVLTVTRGNSNHAAYTYRASDLQPNTETLQIETLNKVLTRSYEGGQGNTVAGRPNGYSFDDGSAIWNYDPAGRISSVTDVTDTFTYGYKANSINLVNTVTGPAHTVANEWETNRDVLLNKNNDPANPSLPSVSNFNYNIPDAANNNEPSGLGANKIGQRKSLVTSGSAFTTTPSWTWNYDPMGQLTSAADATTPNNSRFYSFDDIGNRKVSRTGTSSDSGGISTAYYANTNSSVTGGNALNQYGKIAFADGNAEPVYDLDGNMIFGPVRPAGTSTPVSCVFVWDAENRLVKVKDSTNTATIAEYAYDHLSRRISKTVYPSGGNPVVTRFLYDGWNQIAEYSDTDLKKTYLWGMDLSGTMQGAGGVGGLLSVSERTLNETNPVSTPFYPTFDGNGNVSEYLDSSGVRQAHYEYDPFGNIIASGGDKAGDFSHRFSTKPLDLETGLYYYGYRYFDPLTGRWMSKDPIGERGGKNLYGFVGNDGQNHTDMFGLCSIDDPPKNIEITGIAYAFNRPDNGKMDKMFALAATLSVIPPPILPGDPEELFTDIGVQIMASIAGTQLPDPVDGIRKISEYLKTLAEAALENQGGYIYVDVKYECCSPCWFFGLWNERAKREFTYRYTPEKSSIMPFKLNNSDRTAKRMYSKAAESAKAYIKEHGCKDEAVLDKDRKNDPIVLSW
ncbi:MAG: RHS repeat-associated core domain-containing protein [Verrucomicrobiota bacterium]